ncbi:benzoate/H(+) symporter BenE family transporter [Salmonella enterica]
MRLLSLPLPTVLSGLVAVLVGYASSAAIIWQAALAAGATPAEIAGWMTALGIAMGISTLTLTLWYRAPVLTAWSTPGAALLVTGDDRLGCTALLGVAEALASTPLDIAVFLVASVQEEFNIRGIVPVLRRVRPDLAIGIDITPSCDTPDLQDYSDVRVNHGVGITCLNYHGRGTLAGLITPPRLLRMLETTAHENNIPVQREVAPGVITETGYIQVELDGIPCASLSIPCRYTHSPAEVASLRDLADCIRLLTALANMSPEQFPIEPETGATQEARP